MLLLEPDKIHDPEQHPEPDFFLALILILKTPQEDALLGVGDAFFPVIILD